MSHKITQQDYKNIKRHLFLHSVPKTAYKYGVSPKTVLQVRGSRNFAEYTENNKAQHPAIKHSLADDILEMHDILFNEHDDTYTQPPTARDASVQIKYYLNIRKDHYNDHNSRQV